MQLRAEVYWYYEEEDEDMQEAGEDYAAIISCPSNCGNVFRRLIDFRALTFKAVPATTHKGARLNTEDQCVVGQSVHDLSKHRY